MCRNGAAAGDGSDNSSKEISKEGDCGIIIFDGNGDPLSMHHAGFETTGAGPILYDSYSMALIRIIKAHQSFIPDVTRTISENNDNLRLTSSEQIEVALSRKASLLLSWPPPETFLASSVKNDPS